MNLPQSFHSQELEACGSGDERSACSPVAGTVVKKRASRSERRVRETVLDIVRCCCVSRRPRRPQSTALDERTTQRIQLVLNRPHHIKFAMRLIKEYCCCAIPLLNAGIYITLTEQFVVSITAGILALVTPPGATVSQLCC